jgi:hypothetical protein
MFKSNAEIRKKLWHFNCGRKSWKKDKNSWRKKIENYSRYPKNEI